LRAADVAKLVSRSWKELSAESRAKWEKMAQEDKVRYEREKANYKGPWKIACITQKKGRPKKPMSAFLAFGNERRGSIVEANPSLSNAEVSSLLSQLWRDCPPHIKQYYRDQEATEREIFKQDLKNWEQTQQQRLQNALGSPNPNHNPLTTQTTKPAAFDNLDLEDWPLDGDNDEMFEDIEGIFNATPTSVPAVASRDGHSMKPYNIHERPTLVSLMSTVRRNGTKQENLFKYLLENEELFEDFSPLDSPLTAPFVNQGGILPGRDSPLSGITEREI
jgi:hypothetical protein